MFNFPSQTFFNRRVAKEKLATRLHFASGIRKAFNEQVKAVYWGNVLAERTLNIRGGRNVTEIEVFHLLLNQAELDERVLLQWDKGLPYHVLFILEHNNKVMAGIAFKLKDGSNKAYYSVKRYFYTPWMSKEELNFTIAGLTLDDVYENLVQAVAGENLAAEEGKKMTERVEKTILQQEIQGKIDKLEAQIRKQKQFNRIMELSCEVQKLKQILENI